MSLSERFLIEDKKLRRVCYLVEWSLAFFVFFSINQCVGSKPMSVLMCAQNQCGFEHLNIERLFENVILKSDHIILSAGAAAIIATLGTVYSINFRRKIRQEKN